MFAIVLKTNKKVKNETSCFKVSDTKICPNCKSYKIIKMVTHATKNSSFTVKAVIKHALIIIPIMPVIKIQIRKLYYSLKKV